MMSLFNKLWRFSSVTLLMSLMESGVRVSALFCHKAKRCWRKARISSNGLHAKSKADWRVAGS